MKILKKICYVVCVIGLWIGAVFISHGITRVALEDLDALFDE